MTIEAELRTASESLLATLDRLHALEMQKRAIAPGTPEFVELAERVEALAAAALEGAARQESLAHESRAAVRSGETLERPIEEIPPRAIGEVLGEWRDAERRLTAAERGSEAFDLAQADVHRLRDEYRRAQAAAEVLRRSQESADR